MIEIKEYVGMKITLNQIDAANNVTGAISPTFNIVKDETYTLQFKLTNVSTGNDLDYIHIFDGTNKQHLPNISVNTFKTVGLLKEYKNDVTGYEEKLCFLRFKANFTSSNVRLAIARHINPLDKVGDIVFYLRQIKLAKGAMLNEWTEKPNETLTSVLKTQSQFIQEADAIKATVESIENDVIENKGSLEILDKSVTLAVTSANKAQQTADGAFSYASGEIQVLAGQINQKVTSDDVMSLIQQNPTDVQFWFNKVSPSVTINKNGLIVHNGSVACDALETPSGHQPIVKLFKNGSSYCSVDATRQFESGGFGNAIRLKLDSSNYVYVGPSNIAFYCTGSTNNEQALCTFKGSDNYFELNTKGGLIQLFKNENVIKFNGKNLAFQGSSVQSLSARSLANNNDEIMQLKEIVDMQQKAIEKLQIDVENLKLKINK